MGQPGTLCNFCRWLLVWTRPKSPWRQDWTNLSAEASHSVHCHKRSNCEKPDGPFRCLLYLWPAHNKVCLWMYPWCTSPPGLLILSLAVLCSHPQGEGLGWGPTCLLAGNEDWPSFTLSKRTSKAPPVSGTNWHSRFFPNTWNPRLPTVQCVNSSIQPKKWVRQIKGVMGLPKTTLYKLPPTLYSTD